MVLFTIMSFELRREPCCSVLKRSEYSSAVGRRLQTTWSQIKGNKNQSLKGSFLLQKAFILEVVRD